MQVPMEILHFLHFSLLITLVSSITILPKSIDPFSIALFNFKNEILDHSNTLKDWILINQTIPFTQIHACSWTGVKCSLNSSKIVSLDLSMKNLSGSFSGKDFNLFVDLIELNLSHNSFSNKLPSAIFNLTGLKSLDVSRNNFSGEFPNGISNLQNLVVLDAFSNSFSGPLPVDVSKIESLRVVNFAGSYFSGQIPSEYGSFKNIEFIHLAGNYLSGNLPPELGKLKSLSHMEIGYNSYDGEIPWQFGNMSELQYLDIAGANLSGPIPFQLSNLTKLESLFLFKNQLSGKIPDEFGRILSLKSLDLSDNLISGPIPDGFSDLNNLKLLSLMYNDMSGSVPQGIAKLQELDTLLIWDNYFTGSLPKDLGKFSKLKHLDVSTNYFVGEIPSGICAGGELQKLILFSNNFTGSLFPSLSNCSSLVRLRVEDNSLSGEISLRYGEFVDMSYMDLSRNKFVGGIPSDISQASNLQYFNVSHNPQLGGIVPLNIWSLENLQNFSMSSCGLIGNIPPFQSCKSLYVIELRTNNLSGSIPQSVSNCTELVNIDLAENNLTGSIPMELAKIPVISTLDLSHNKLMGRIPSEFESSSSLKLLNVSYNDISGSIPPNNIFSSMEESAFVGNPKLCGAPFRPCHRGISNGLELGSRKAQNLAWILILCAFIVLFIMASVFAILHFKRVCSKGNWKMVAVDGIPQFDKKDVLRSLGCIEFGKVVLPMGITVWVKKFEWDPKSVKVSLRLLNNLGTAKHKNLSSLLGVFYNKNVGYLLYEYLPNGSLDEQMRLRADWEIKRRIVIGVARALSFLHHDCFPAILHGNLKGCNVLLDENMEPHLAEFGISWINSTIPAKTGGFDTSMGAELHKDVYDFGGLMIEVLTNGKAPSGQICTRDLLLKQVADENGIAPSNLSGSEMLSFIEVALLCRRSRPPMQHVLKLLSDLKPHTNGGILVQKDV